MTGLPTGRSAFFTINNSWNKTVFIKMLSSINRSGNSNIIVSSLMTGQNGIKARGIARVFEATVGYEIQDESGNKLTNGSITAAAGGPNWGYFELVLNELPEDAAKLKLFQPSAMDGSKLDLVELKLK